MHDKKIVNALLKAHLGIFLIITVFLSGFSAYVYNTGFYNNQYEKNGAYKTLGRDKVDYITTNLFGYFQDKINLDEKNYSEREVLHLEDVKNLINNAHLFFYASLIILMMLFAGLFLTNRKGFYKDIQKMFLSTGFIIIGLIGILMIVGSWFSTAFTKFHELFFTNDLWRLNSGDTLIILYPESFWIAISVKIILTSLFTAIFLLALGFILWYYKKRQLILI